MTLSEILLLLIASCCILLSLYVITTLTEIHSRLCRIHIALLELQIQWIDTFGEKQPEKSDG